MNSSQPEPNRLSRETSPYLLQHAHNPVDWYPWNEEALADESLPAGNGVAARALGRLGHLVGDTRYLAAAEKCLQAAWPHLFARDIVVARRSTIRPSFENKF